LAYFYALVEELGLGVSKQTFSNVLENPDLENKQKRENNVHQP
jgi:hypothetical protein